jgi:ParB family chromosome partitioning protein
LIHIDPYDFIDDVAAHFVGDNENNQQGAEEVLLSVIDGLDDEKLPGLALRLALTGHVDVPREGEIDHLAEAEKLLASVQPKPAPKKSTTKAVRKSASAKSKSAKKKAGKKVAA